MAGGVICWDLAGVLGWSYAGADVVRAWPANPGGLFAVQRGPWAGVHHGFYDTRCNGAGMGAQMATARDFIATKLDLLRPAAMFSEAPIPVRGKTSFDVHRRLLGLQAIAAMAAHEANVFYETVPAVTVRKSLTGSGGSKKPDVIWWCRRLGWEPRDNNAADALAVLWWAVPYLRERFGGRT